MKVYNFDKKEKRVNNIKRMYKLNTTIISMKQKYAYKHFMIISDQYIDQRPQECELVESQNRKKKCILFQRKEYRNEFKNL